MQSAAEDIWRTMMSARDVEVAVRTRFMLSGIARWQERFGLFSSHLSSFLSSFLTSYRFGSRRATITRSLALLLASSFGYFGRRAMRLSLRINLRHAISSAYESFTGSPGLERQ
ncbi:hypothetical protein LINPERHAP1_LOCUS13281 [Linum perenne]